MYSKQQRVKALYHISETSNITVDKKHISLQSLSNLEAPEEEEYSKELSEAWDDLMGKELKPREVVREQLGEIEHDSTFCGHQNSREAKENLRRDG